MGENINNSWVIYTNVFYHILMDKEDDHKTIEKDGDSQ